MLLNVLIILPFLGSILCYLSSFYNIKFPRWIALFTTTALLLITCKILYSEFYIHHLHYLHHSFWNYEYCTPWIPQLGINFHLALDGLSILMLVTTGLLGIFSIFCHWNELDKSTGMFYSNLLCILSCTIGIFLSIDLFLFFCFWELILLPIYFVTIFWGNSSLCINNRTNSANKFLIYSQLSSLLMLVAIIHLVVINYNDSHILTFDYNILKNIKLTFWTEFFIMMGFFIPFIVKMPIIPFHGWLPDLQKSFPTSSSIDLVSVVLKTSLYGILRFNISLFPTTSIYISKYAILLGLFTFFYGSFLIIRQKNIKKIISYTSISHAGIMLIGAYLFNITSYKGLIIYTISNMLSTSGLLILIQCLYFQFNTYNLKKIKIADCCKKWISGSFLFFLLANLGIPGTGNFVGELLILLGSFKHCHVLSIGISIGLVIATTYSMYIIYNMYFGTSLHFYTDFHKKKFIKIQTIILILLIIIIGLCPKTIGYISSYPLNKILKNLLYTY
ncbi:NuoM family protein [Buchnera aphidicola]|uniref:NADH-quinone oxidoreductase subunit M n=1 Tax=Buchnera aphidicola (Anoecia oenotherae) TaxID=1241833 RepID=A0A4D6XXT6_9GAMM|nr:NADH-quinone oxidoreductase subunit M [Buchnera aphidicola]QCI19268.1 NADH-quinone oxidoreductase subunit M [Buchnera aphidicola (Anoecia oenotherae)]